MTELFMNLSVLVGWTEAERGQRGGIQILGATRILLVGAASDRVAFGQVEDAARRARRRPAITVEALALHRYGVHQHGGVEPAVGAGRPSFEAKATLQEVVSGDFGRKRRRCSIELRVLVHVFGGELDLGDGR